MNDEERLNRLERQNRRLKYWTIVMVLAGLALLIMGQAALPKVHDLIRAKKIEVVPKEGKTAVLLRSWKRGGAVFTFSPKGTDLIALIANDGGDGLLWTKSYKGKFLVELSATVSGDGEITTYDAGEGPLMKITSRTNGEGVVVQYNRAGKPSAVWPAK